MKTIRRAFLLGAALVAANVTNPAPAHAQYSIDYLISPYKDGIRDSWMFGINNAGQTTGYTATTDGMQNAITYQQGNFNTIVSNPRDYDYYSTVGLAINDRGDVAGNSKGTPTLFAANGATTPIDTTGMNRGVISGLNNAGTVLVSGTSPISQSSQQTFALWSGGTSRRLTTLDSLYPYTLSPDPTDSLSGFSARSGSFGITNLAAGNRFAAGVRYTTYEPATNTTTTKFLHAFAFDGQNGYHLLQESNPDDTIQPINTRDDGSVFGWAGERLAMWNPDGSLKSLLPDFTGGLAGNIIGYGTDAQMNGLGQIVAITKARGVAFYDPITGMWTDISSTISGLDTGRFSSIQGFNNQGQFVGLVAPPLAPSRYGVYGFVVSAVPEPGSIALLLGVGVSGGMFALRRRRRSATI